ncbi:bifunctional Cation-transporting P-type ATPase [Babesia duncani]|uniref:P-type Ca(2+) transporter n=1 Tax=Babesia duncani TaxID=323732 RepID=A0AAD9PIM2_9APIC|nr:bifunctional Cation-transporting P-type ATPase [Babesia duncani]
MCDKVQLPLFSNPHTAEASEILDYYKVSLERGLSDEDVAKNRRWYGAHVLLEQKKVSIFELLCAQFDDLLVRILLVAALASFVLTSFDGGDFDLGAYIEPLVILVILLLNAIVGVWQEANAEKALDALQKLQPVQTSCLRNGQWVTLDTFELVVGDVVRVKSGDKVPSDMRIIKITSTSLAVEQSQLTGESTNVSKTSQALLKSMEKCGIQDKKNMLFSATTVSYGSAICVVVATGMATEIGAIQLAVMEAAKLNTTTPLQEMLNDFGATLSKAISGICVLVWVINIRNFSDSVHGGTLRGCIYYFKIAIALAVAAIPEGLPAVITTCLALGTRKMAKRNAIVRKLPSVETLGCTSVICTDKTGTLTTNKMCPVEMALVIDSRLQTFNFCPDTETILVDGKEFKTPFTRVVDYVAACASLCNDASIINGRQGEPTEIALLNLVDKIGRAKSIESLHAKILEKSQRMATLEFCRDRKIMSVLATCEAIEGVSVFSKGAPECLLERCTKFCSADGRVLTMDQKMKMKISAEIARMATDSLRTLGLAYRPNAQSDVDLYKVKSLDLNMCEGSPAFFGDIEQDLIFLGLCGIIDPPRPNVRDAILSCKSAGIRVIMITGDNKLTADAIARKVGIFPDDWTSTDTDKYYSFTGKEFENLSQQKQRMVLSGEAIVFSRTEPRHKQEIVNVLKGLGETVAMTGDGVNDAPALKAADIGVAMGISGTEVAKEASDMVLADDNFQTIVAAIEEGRSIYCNMKAFIRYMISSNVGEVVSIFLTAALGIPEGLLPVQLLWVNLVTDGPPATALGFNPPDADIMLKPPRVKDERLIDGWTLFRYLVIGSYVGIATVGIFIWYFVFGTSPTDGNTLVPLSILANWSECHDWHDFHANRIFNMTSDPCTYFTLGKIKASTLSLTTLVVLEMLNAYNALSEECSLLQMPPWTNLYLVFATSLSMTIHCIILYVPALAKIFGVVPLDAHDWIAVLVWSAPILVIDEILKLVAKRRRVGIAPGAGTQKPKLH